MFDFDTTKLLLVGVVALLVIPAKDLPRVIRQVGQMVGKVRRMAAEFQGQVMEALKEAELDDLKKEITSITDSAKAEVTAITDAAKVDIDINPAADAQREITKAIEADGAKDASAADVYAKATAAPALPAAPVNEHALASLAMPEVPAAPSVTHDLIAAQAGLPQVNGAAHAAAGNGAADTKANGRKPRGRRASVTAGDLENATALAEADADADARVPYRKRVAYVPPGRAARAARRES